MIRCSRILAATVGLAVLFGTQARASELTDSLKKGTPELKSAGQLAFGPEGILFVGDTAGTTVFAIATGDTKGDSKAAIKQEKLPEKIGAMLGASAADITINDMKVNPESGNLYISIARGKGASGMPAIVKLDRASGKLSQFELKDVPVASVKLGAAGGKQPGLAITGLVYAKGKLYLAGLSAEEFASNFRVIPFPFKEIGKGSSTEIFHGAHGRLETNSPIRTFTIIDIAKEANLLASYTCTPLVRIPVDNLKPGEKVKGTTVAELGNGNTPLDMVPYNRDGKNFVLMTNTKHGLIKVKLEGIEKVEPINAKVATTAGLTYDKITELKDVVQIDRLDGERFVYLNKEGLLDTVPLP
jgi:hypothetical protein